MRYELLERSVVANANGKLYSYLRSRMKLFVPRATHYCSMDTMDKIIDTGYLWAVDCHFLNDLSEFNYGIRILDNKFTGERNKLRRVIPMITSFCTDSDSVYHWALYAKEIGIGIEFNFEVLDYWRNPTIKVNKDFEYPPEIAQVGRDENEKIGYIRTGISFPIQVSYCSEGRSRKLAGRFNGIIDEVIAESDNASGTPEKDDLLISAAILIKGSAFSFERESRISTFAVDNDQNSNIIKSDNYKYEFQSKSAYLRPYVNICYLAGRNINIGWPIETIRIGPGREQQKAYESVVKRLELGKVTVFPIPYVLFVKRARKYVKTLIINFKEENLKNFDIEENIKEKLNNIDIENTVKKMFLSINKIIKQKLLYYRKNHIGEKFYKLVIDDNFDGAKKIIELLQIEVRDYLNKQFEEIEIEKWLTIYENKNYYSFHGITVCVSKNTYSFT